MKEEPTNKCKEQNFVHAWQNITENIVYATMPPQYPPKQEQCQNCGLTRTFHKRVEKWFEYEIKEIEPMYSSTAITTSLTGGGGTATINSTLVNNLT